MNLHYFAGVGMEDDEEEKSIYNPDYRQELLDDDEIDAKEEAFMNGYNQSDEEE